MFVPITSEVIIEKGTMLKEISTGKLYEVGVRMVAHEEVLGDDPWEITESESGNSEPRVLAMRWDDLAAKYFAEVN